MVIIVTSLFYSEFFFFKKMKKKSLFFMLLNHYFQLHISTPQLSSSFRMFLMTKKILAKKIFFTPERPGPKKGTFQSTCKQLLGKYCTWSRIEVNRILIEMQYGFNYYNVGYLEEPSGLTPRTIFYCIHYESNPLLFHFF